MDGSIVFARLRQYAPHLTRASLYQNKSVTQTASVIFDAATQMSRLELHGNAAILRMRNENGFKKTENI